MGLAAKELEIETGLKLGIQSAIDNGCIMTLVTYALLDQTEATIKLALQKMLYHYNRMEWFSSLYNVIKEIGVNAIKSNMKNLFFEGLENSELSAAQMTLKMQDFREKLHNADMDEFARQSLKAGRYVKVLFYPKKDCFYVEVRNNSLYSNDDELRIRQKLNKIMNTEDLADIFTMIDNENDPFAEGAGMGMAIITRILVTLEIDPHCFTIFRQGKETISRLEIPIKNAYQTRRKLYTITGRKIADVI